MAHDTSTDGIRRRTFVQAAGTVAGLGALGIGASATAAAEEFDLAFANRRVREAAKVWDRGFRGRADRTIGLTDTGIEARHPDVGPWNGVRADLADDGGMTLVSEGYDLVDPPDSIEEIEGTLGPGVAGTARETHEFTAPDDADRVEASLSWEPSDLDLDLVLETADGEVIDESRVYQYVEGSVTPGETYVFAVEAGITGNVQAEYTIDAHYLDDGPDGSIDPFADVTDEITPDTPKVVGWYNEGARYGRFAWPRDPHGHGTHVSSIMAGTGRASTIDPDSVRVDQPHALLAAGDVLTYVVRAQAGTGVFGSAYGENIELEIQGPNGQTLDRSDFQEGDATVIDDKSVDGTNVVVENPTVHDAGEATYQVYVRPQSGEVVSAGRATRITVGTFVDADSTVGDRTDGDRTAGDRTDGDRTDGDTTALHTGVAPNVGLVGLQGLADPPVALGEHADWFAETFNLRAVNMSWGYVGGIPVGAFGGQTEEAIDDTNTVENVRKMAAGGILTVAAAGNSSTPANGNSAPAVADEALSVVSTGPLDGITDYSSGGLGGFDEDDGGVYLKPDVTAPGGGTTDLINAAATGDPWARADEQPPIRDYTELAGTSMASPFVNGTAGLVAEAMEFDAPDPIALPPPADTTWADLARLKQIVLATATETVFTAAPYHKAHVPTYDFGGRDPYEGFGRVNPDAAVDAVTRRLDPGTAEETLGLDVPRHDRAVAGYIRGEPGVYEVSVEFSHYSGGNRGMTRDDPHIDLFVYDAEEPAEHGEPNVVGFALGLGGSATLQFSASKERPEGVRCGTFPVVAKLVNVPGAANGFDVLVHLDLSVDLVEDLVVFGTRSDRADAFTAGQTATYDLQARADEPVVVRDRIPTEWEVYDGQDDVAAVVPAQDGRTKYVYLDRDGNGATDGDDLATAHAYRYHVRVAEETGHYRAGPLEVTTDPDAGNESNAWIAVPGTTDDNVVAGASTAT